MRLVITPLSDVMRISLVFISLMLIIRRCSEQACLVETVARFLSELVCGKWYGSYRRSAGRHALLNSHSNDLMEQVILVDESDNAIGTMEKMEAHRKGVLHRAFSVVVFNSKGELLLQKRALTKYHSGGLWTNTCCSHPAPSEAIEAAVRRRLQYEMGVDVAPEFAFKFTYRASLDHGLTEHELDHVFTATFDGQPHVNPTEVSDWKYVDLRTLRTEMASDPDRYTAWFKYIVDRLG